MKKSEEVRGKREEVRGECLKKFASTPNTRVAQITLPSGRKLSCELEAEQTASRAQAWLYDNEKCVCRIEFFDRYQTMGFASGITRGALYALASKAGRNVRRKRGKGERAVGEGADGTKKGGEA